MANENILDRLIAGAGRTVGGAAREYGQGGVAGAGAMGAGGMLTPAGQGMSLPAIAIEEGMKVLKKFYKSAAEEMMKQPGGEQALAATVDPEFSKKFGEALTGTQAAGVTPAPSYTGQPTGTSALGVTQAEGVPQAQPITPAETQKQDVLKNLLNFMGIDLSKGLAQSSSTEGGVYKPASMLFGLIGEKPEVTLARQQAAGLAQEARGEKPLQPKDILDAQVDIHKANMTQMSTLAKQGVLSAKDLFSGFTKESEQFVKVRDAHGRVEAAGKDPSAAGDLALIFNYMKVLDPGSTVREGEFANAENSGAAWQTVGRLYNKLLSGKRLTAKQRNDFIDRSRRLFKAQERQQSKAVNEYKTLAKRNGIDPATFMIDVGLAQEGTMQQKATQSTKDIKQTVAKTGTTSSGNKFRSV